MKIFLLLPLLPLAFCLRQGTCADKSTSSYGVALINNGFRRIENLEGFPAFCMGALIGAQIVLTIANCCQADKDHVFEPSIKLGASYVDKGEDFRLEKFLILGKDSTPLHYRFCLIKLHHRVRYSPYLMPYFLPTKTELFPAFEEPFTVFGYGNVQEETYDFAVPMTYCLNEAKPVMRSVQECTLENGKANTEISVECLGAADKQALRRYDHGAPLVHNYCVHALGVSNWVGVNVTNYRSGFATYFLRINGTTRDMIIKGMQELYS